MKESPSESALRAVAERGTTTSMFSLPTSAVVVLVVLVATYVGLAMIRAARARASRREYVAAIRTLLEADEDRVDLARFADAWRGFADADGLGHPLRVQQELGPLIRPAREKIERSLQQWLGTVVLASEAFRAQYEQSVFDEDTEAARVMFSVCNQVFRHDPSWAHAVLSWMPDDPMGRLALVRNVEGWYPLDVLSQLVERASEDARSRAASTAPWLVEAAVVITDAFQCEPKRDHSSLIESATRLRTALELAPVTDDVTAAMALLDRSISSGEPA